MATADYRKLVSIINNKLFKQSVSSLLVTTLGNYSICRTVCHACVKVEIRCVFCPCE